MKFRNLALAIATSALLQTLAFADDYGDAIRASFIRDLNHEIAARYLPSPGLKRTRLMSLMSSCVAKNQWHHENCHWITWLTDTSVRRANPFEPPQTSWRPGP